MSRSVYQKKPRTLIKDVSYLKEPKRLAINKHKEDRYCALAQSSNPQHPPSPQISKAKTCFFSNIYSQLCSEHSKALAK